MKHPSESVACPPRQRWLDHLQGLLAQRQQQQTLRRLRVVEPRGRLVVVDGRELLNLASNDYLGLSQHPHVKAAAIAVIEQAGVGSGASRLVAGTLPQHAALERRFASFKHAEAALFCPTGYMANLAALTSLASPGQLIAIDKRTHASLIDAARATGAVLRTYPHLNLHKLDRLLATQRGDHPAPPLIVTDSVFSMDGDVADLPALCELADRHGAVLIVDEAHGTGVLGARGAGLAEAQAVAGRIDVTISTASKALGGLGGLITGSSAVIQTIVNCGRSFIYTTAAPPGQAAAVEAALDVVRDEPQRRLRLAAMSQRVREAAASAGYEIAPAATPTPIVPLITGTPASALALAERLEEKGLLAVAIRPPTVAPNTSRVRLSLRADLTDDDVERLCRALRRGSS